MRALLKIAVVAILVIGVVAASFLAGFGTSWVNRSDAPYPVPDDLAEEQQGRLRVLLEVWQLVETNFYGAGALDEQKLINGTIRGLVASLDDPHTTWIEPTGAAILREDMTGRFEGIGATVDMVDEELTIINPLPQSPAERAGLQPGDVVLEADGRVLRGMDLLQAVALIRGPEGTTVHLLIRRTTSDQELSLEITVERAKLDLPTVEYRMLPREIAYLQLYEFNGRAGREMRQALVDLLAKEPIGLIFDLRNNPGGLLSEAVSVSSEFIDSGVILTERKNPEDEGETYEADPGGLATEIPLVVLINGFSASASEIVAGAIQDYERGVLVGTVTYGKGSMQMPHTLSDQSSFVVTIARWFTPSGRQIEGQGLHPDIIVEIEDTLISDRDPQLERAVEYLLEGR